MRKNKRIFWSWLFKPLFIKLPRFSQRKPMVWSASPFVIFIFIMLFVIFLMLANWQYQKGKRLQQNTQSNMQLRDQSFNSLRDVREIVQIERAAINRAKVSLTASILPEPVVLHDNRIREKRIGVDVLLWVQPGENQDQSFEKVLINMGWMPWPDRNQFPVSQLIQQCFKNFSPTKKINIAAEVIVPPVGLFHLSEKHLLQRVRKSPETFLVQSLEQAVISQTLTTNLSITTTIEPYILWLRNASELLDNECPLEQNWPDPNSIGISAEKHRSYALQWLSFAAILLGLFIGLNLGRSKPGVH
ncbi:MAG: SURF1 family protein [Pseudomonadota bacterium]